MNDRMDKPQRIKISEILRELSHLEQIREPEEKIEAYNRVVSDIHSLAEQTQDSKLFGLAEEFSTAQHRSQPYLNAEIVQKDIRKLQIDLEKIGDILPNQIKSSFQSCINNFEEALFQVGKKAAPAYEKLSVMREVSSNELIGRRLEREVAPDLAEQMGYVNSPNIIRHSNKDIEVDYLGEKNQTTSPFGNGRLIKKQVLIIETKTTICQEDITSFSGKVKLIKEKYERASLDFSYNLEITAWIFACYKWTDELKQLAKNLGIQPFDNEELCGMLRTYHLIDRRFPICP